MNFGSTHPSAIRAQFKRRTFDNVAVIFFAFVIVIVFASSLLSTGRSGWFAVILVDAAVIAVAAYFYTVFEHRSIGFRCTKCDKYIESNTPWVCGFCRESNTNIDNFPFSNRCERCGAEPKAYRCHHDDCENLNFLTADELKTNFAYCLNSKAENAPAPDVRTEQKKTYEAEKEKVEQEIAMTELAEKLQKIKERKEGPKMKTPFEQKKESFDRHLDGAIGLREYARQKKAEATEKYKDDPEALQDAVDAIDDFLRQNI